ncbi:tandem-95 repeat protein [Planctomycetaceae bacterium SH139]
MANRSHAKKQSSLHRKLRQSRRHLLLQALERRELLTAEVPMPVWAPGTPMSDVDDYYSQFGGPDGTDPILQGSRWSNPVGGPSPNQGDPAIVTWSIVPDGTETSTGDASDLVAFLDGIYGDGATTVVEDKPWFRFIERAYQDWSNTSGVFFVYEPNDDGADMDNAARGVAGVRGDVRVSGSPIDGNSGILAFNFFPNNGGNSGTDGDMVIDTSDNFYENNSDGPGGENRALVNIAAHEAGHGIGVAHSIPINGTKLLEPFINLGFFGVQEDDIINANRLYGDRYELEEQNTGVIGLGTLGNGTRGVFDLSIDGATDVDLFEFTINSPRILGAVAQPVGTQYDVGPQGGSPSPFDALRQSNLNLRVLNEDGTLIAERSTAGLGVAEVLEDLILPQAGTYLVEVSGIEDATQMYEFQLLLEGFNDVDPTETAPRLISVNPNAGEIFDLDANNLLFVSPTELTFRFDGSQRLDPETLEGIRITRSGGDGTFDDGNEEIIDPGFLGFGESERIVISRFANPLPDDQYRIEIFGFDLPGSNIIGLRNIEGQLFQPEDINADREEIHFEIEIGALVTAVVPQPIEEVGGVMVQQRNQVHVYFNEDPLSDPANGPVSTGAAGAPSVVNRDFYKLFFTAETVENTDDAVLLPDNVLYDPAINRAVLTFPMDLSDWAPVDAVGGAGTLRLRIGSSELVPAPPSQLTVDADESLAASPGDTFASARSLGALFGGSGQSVVIDSHISPVSGYQLQWPGAGDEAGVRNIRRNSQLVGRADTELGISTLFYNFKQEYGEDTQGNTLDNAITEAQRQRLREALDLYEQYLGVRFVESADRGLHIVTGDMRAVEITAEVEEGGNLSIYRSSDLDPGVGLLILDGAEDWHDGFGQSPDDRPSWFLEALRQVGSLLGIGDLFDRPAGTAAGSEDELSFGLLTEPDFLSQSDITLGQHLFRPESRDIDLYEFNVADSGRLSAETFAERLSDSSLLDTALTLWRRLPGGGADDYELIARNNDFYSNDSFVGIDVEPGQYVIGVSAAGNEAYNPKIADSGLGGFSQGRYQLRLVFEAAVQNTIEDIDGTPLDGDADGVAGGNYNFWFRTADAYDGSVPLSTTVPPAQPRTLFVSKRGVDSTTTGTLANPLRTVDQAMRFAFPGDIIRLLPDAGDDNDFETLADNRAYEIGRGGVGNAELSDGLNLEVKRGVTVMIDSGAILKMRASQISVGSNSVDSDRSLGALQVLGTPIMVDGAGAAVLGADGTPLSGRVIFTSYDDQQVGLDTNPLQTTPSPGQWGGISFRNDVDYAQGRPVAESEGIFVNYVGQADIRFGGGAVGARAVTPISMNESRPAIKYTIFRDGADAAISADPNSFEETNFHSPLFQQAVAFTSDYVRVGPDLAGLQFDNNSINGLFIRIDTPTAGQLEPMSVSGRFDDRDVTHVLSQQLILQGQPGGPLLETELPSVLSVTVNSGAPAATDPTPTLAAGTYDYRLTFVDIDGGESLASLPTRAATVAAGQVIRLAAIPSAPGEFVGRRLYRLDPGSGDYVFVTQLNKSQQTYTDTGMTRGGILDTTQTEKFRARFDARLSIDPGVVMKVQTSRIEAAFGADFYAEGLDGRSVIFTSRQDDRYGAGGNFDTNNDGSPDDGGDAPTPGDWGGLVIGQGSSASLDFALITFAGGNALIEGGFSNFNAIEVLQGDLRLANSTLESNADGLEADLTRAGRGFNDAATLFIRGSQPVIVGNSFRDNAGAAISINPDSLNFYNVTDLGRGTGGIDQMVGFFDNQGPLIRDNQLSDNGINGLKIRPEVLTTESVWDDTDIVHVVAGDVIVVDHHYVGGLRLEASPDESLVVKFDDGAGLIATGRPLDIEDRIGGTLQIVGQPGFPVILTSLLDDSVGAGFTTDGRAQTDTNGGRGLPAPGDWDGIQLDVFANDRNVSAVLENEPALATAAEFNAIPGTAQFIGVLATEEKAGDENERLGFTVNGTLSDPGDLDVYSFLAQGGTEVWVDLDRTTYALDSVVELIDMNGNVLVLSDDSFTEESNTAAIFRAAEIGELAHSLSKTGVGHSESPNPGDAGFRVVLPGAQGEDALYFIRVRSSNLGPNDPASNLLDPSMLREGRSQGAYRLGIRLREVDEVAGSKVTFADIRYAVNGIDLVSAPLHSPLAGEAAERLTLENGVLVDTNNRPTGPIQLGDPLGNLLSTDRGVISVTGRIGNQSLLLNPAELPEEDFDVYAFEVVYDSLEDEIFEPDSRFVPVTFDIDYADGLGRVNTSLAIYDSAGRLVLIGRDSNIADDVGSPLRGSDSTNLSAGSAGVLDASIGPVELPEGSYRVVVHSDMTMPETFDQFTNPNSSFQDVRVLPINSVRQIASDPLDDHLVPPLFPLPNVQFLDYPAEQAIIEPLFDTDALVPYTLEDVSLFVAFQGGVAGGRNVLTVFDPFTGTFERTIGDVALPIADLDFRGDGELYAFTTGPAAGGRENANTGNYINISTRDASVISNSDDGIEFRRNNANGDGTEADPGAQLIVNAMTYIRSDSNITDGDRVFVVGTRDNGGRFGEVIWNRNLMYANVATTGATTNAGSTGAPDRDFGNGPYIEPFGPASQKFELGVIDTGNLGLGPGTGGDITGLIADPIRPGIFYGVDTVGGVYEIDLFGPTQVVDLNGAIPGPYFTVLDTTFMGQIAPDPRHTLNNLNFSGLAHGPLTTQGGEYANTYFATTSDGWMYAFERLDVGPNPVPINSHVFANGERVVQMRYANGAPVGRSPVGLTFGTLERNPWHQTGDRSGNGGHGLVSPYDSSRPNTTGGSSLYFGFEPSGDPAENAIELAEDDPRGQLAPGGAHGSALTQPFSLEGFNETDKPTLYFSYFLETEGVDFSPSQAMLDSFRVYASGDDGQWQLLSTNNSYREAGDIDEFDYFGATEVPVQELHDNVDNWRQARVDISPFAGNKEVRIRFDYATAGAMNFSGFGYRTEILAVPGEDLADGDILQLQDSLNPFAPPITFEVDLGYVIDVPSGVEINIGDSFDVTFGGNTQTVTFINGVTSLGNAAIDASMTSSQVADEILAALDPAINAVRFGAGSVGLTAATNLVNNAAGSGVVVSGTRGIDPTSDVPIIVEGNLTRNQVAQRLREAFVAGLGTPNATVDNYAVFAGRVTVHQFFALESGPFGANTDMPGDEFGAFNSPIINSINTAPGSNNEVEGVYLDDIIIGFAERGEMVLGAPASLNFISNPESDPRSEQPERPNEILTGAYNLEIRTSAEFGVPDDSGALLLNEDIGLGRSFDTNDRLGSAVTLIAQPGGEIRDGDTFVLFDGTRRMTFEFDSIATPGVAEGRVAVPFDPRVDRATDVARSMRDAINSPQVQLVLDIRASSGDSFEVGETTSNRVELFGEAIFVNPTEGRNLKVNLVAEENFRDRVAAQTMPQVPQQGAPVEYVLEADTLARAYPTRYYDGATDTLVATGKIGDRATSGTAGEILVDDDPRNDIDIIKIHLFAGNEIDIDLDAITTTKGAQRLTLPLLLVNDQDGNPLAFSLDPGMPTTAPGESVGEAFIRFTAPNDGYYFISVLTQDDPLTGLPATFGDYQLNVRPASDRNDVLYVDYHFDHGDQNRFREQGQIVIDSNFISDSSQWAVRATASPRNRTDISDLSGTELPKPGVARLLRNQNTSRLLPGSVISNNVIVGAGSGGILFSGDASPNGQMPGPVPFGRIVNNTVVGSPAAGDIGIDVGANASPTVINNVMSGFDTGLRVNASAASLTTIVGGNIFRDNNNASNFPLGNSSFNLDLPTFPNKALFSDPNNRIFIPADGSLAIDSSFAEVSDRQAFFNTVKQPSGIGISPIIAPEIDAYGQPRVDDPFVQTPAGVGSDVFIDRGALDRADFAGPVASIAVPVDFVAGQGEMMIDGDIDGTPTFLTLPTGVLEFFEIQLLEPMGSGPNAATVISQSVVLTENGRRMVEGIDYNFGYSAASNTIRLTPLSGIWRPDAAYEITLNNRDRLVIQAPSGDGVNDGDQIVVTDANGTRGFFEVETGYVLSVPQTLTLVVPAGEGGAGGFRDGDQFVIRAPDGTSETFELNVFGDISGGVTEVPVAPGSTAEQIRNAILGVLLARQADLDIAPAPIGRNQIHLGTIGGHFVDTLTSPLAAIGVNAGIVDGDYLTYRSGTTELKFEFNLDTDADTQPDTNVVIPFSRSDTHLQLAEKLAAAFRDADFRLNDPRALGDGRVHLGGLVGDLLDTSMSAASQQGVPGVTDSLTLAVETDWTGFNEGDQFAISVNGATTIFELGFDRDVAPGAEPIRLAVDDDIDAIVGKVIGSIINANLGLTPTDEGDGVIRLNESFGVELDLLGFAGAATPALTSDGVPAGAVPVPIIPSPSLSPDGVAAQIVGAIRRTPLVSQVFTPGGGSIWFADTAEIVGIDVLSVDAIRDLAGNRLQPNRASEETQFTILMPNVELDFGDAPASYDTLSADNGARNTLGNRSLPRLGRLIDSEPDGQPASDDNLGDLVVNSGGGAGAIGAVTPSATLANAFVTAIGMPTASDEGAQLILQTAGQFFVYELDSDGTLADPSFIPVLLTPGMSAEDLASALATSINTTTSLAAARAQGTDLLVYGGDEDGVPVGNFQANAGVASISGMFFDDQGGFLSFLNPLDSAVEAMVITTGGGLLDAWIDFNQDGTFDPGTEQVLFSQPVLDGRNRILIDTPADAVEGLTWARFRLSRTGSQSPSGVAISGEVEDYQVRVAAVQPPELNDDVYVIDEDNTLTVTGIASNVLANDQIVSLDPTSITVLLEDEPLFGTLTLNPNGDFEFIPDGNYYGDDSFTYRLFGLAELVPGNPAAGLLPVRSSELGTVSITVNPINDEPRAVDKSGFVLEDLTAGLTFTAAELLVDALPADLQVATEPPWDESDQSLRITAIGNGVDSVSAPTGVGAETNSVVTAQGITVLANFMDGALVDVTYFPANHYNEENPLDPAAPLPSLDHFTFTVTDDGRTVYLDGSEIPALPEESATATVTITVGPVNDPPEFDFVNEHIVAEDSGFVMMVAADNLLPGPDVALDEAGQTVSFTLTPDPANRTGLFSTPPTIDINGMLSFQPAPNQVGTVVYTVVAMDDGPNDPTIGDDPEADPVQLTITITPVNDAPEFTGAAELDVLEDNGPFAAQYASDVRPGPVNATDETGQNLVFQVTADPANPAGLIVGLPTIDATGLMRFTSGVDAVGSARFFVTLIDDGGTNNPGDIDTSPAQTVTLNVRPVNDSPRLLATDPVRYNVLEDNVLVIPVNGGAGSLLDQFSVGPANEADGTLGGNQELSFVDFGTRRTDHGMVETITDANGVVVELRYYPDENYNSGSTLAVGDRILFTVADDGTTWSLADDGLNPDPLTADYEIEVVIEPVNDRPSFAPLTRNIRRLEDVGSVVIPGWASNITVGPPTAGDETNPVTGQTLFFDVQPAPGFTQAQMNSLFSQPPVVSNEGTLSFTSAPDAVGTVVVLVTAVDSGANDPLRGDNRFSTPATVTLTLAPVNDAPIANPEFVEYELDEDNALVIPLTNADGTGLYDIFTVGPANEGPGVTPGGNQTFATDATLYPQTTVGGGRIEPVLNGAGQLSGLRYIPALDFNGTDTFVYGVRDNGQTFNLNSGQLVNAFAETFATVSLTVNAVNDRPQFAGGVSVNVSEDAGSDDPALPAADVGLSIIEDWATNIFAGPPTALDEVTQPLSFEITYVSGADPSVLFSEFPSVDPATGELRFRTNPDANGQVQFEVVLVDEGPEGFVDNDPNRPEHQNRSVARQFAISVEAVNDAPVFTPGGLIGPIDEDSGPFNLVWATNISPGPADEVAAGQAVLFDVQLSVEDQAKFSVQPTISDGGLLRFTLADNANGIVVANVVARDTAGAIASPPATLTIDITAINDRPIAVEDAIESNEDALLSIPAGDLLINDIDFDLPNDSLSILEVSGPSLQGADVRLSEDGSTVIYDPSVSAAIQALRPGETANDIFTYRIVDLEGAASEPATVTITLAGVNDAPLAANDAPSINSVGSTTFAPLLNDIDVDGEIIPGTLLVTLQPAFGSLTVAANGLMTYTPFASFNGSDTIRYVVRDDNNAVSNQAEITISVNDAPLAVNDFVLGYRNEAVTFAPLANDVDPTGQLDISSIEVLVQPTSGSVIINDDGTLTYSPDPGSFGLDRLMYRVSDLEGTPSNVAEVQINVVPSRLQNPNMALDVNDSGQVSPIDALLIINHLNRGGETDIESLIPGPPYLDVDGNGRVAPIDALQIINFLNRNPQSGGEGEGPALGGPLTDSGVLWAGLQGSGLSGEGDSTIEYAEATYGPLLSSKSQAADAESSLWDLSDDEDDETLNQLIDQLASPEAASEDVLDALWTSFEDQQ